MSWAEQILNSLVIRDQTEKRHDDMVFAFMTAAERVTLAPTSGGVILNDGEKDKEISRLYREVAEKTEQLQSLTGAYNQLKTKHELVAAELHTLQVRTQINSEENGLRTRALQDLNDEILSLQIELNVNEDKRRMLESDNKALVKRWMRKVSDDADKMNEANAFLEKYVPK